MRVPAIAALGICLLALASVTSPAEAGIGTSEVRGTVCEFPEPQACGALLGAEVRILPMNIPTTTSLVDGTFLYPNVTNDSYAIQVTVGCTELGCYNLHPFTVAGADVDLVVRPYAYGDANCNAAVNAIDASIVLQFVAGLLFSVPCDDATDVNRDGATSAVDAALVLQYSAGLIDSLPT